MGAQTRSPTAAPRRIEALAYIIERIQRSGTSPSYGEIGRALRPTVVPSRARQLVDQLVELAVRFLYLQRLAFGGKIVGRNYGVKARDGSRFNLSKLRAELKLLSRRLEPVQVEQLSYAEVIRRYDHADALFYLDPPYDETAGYGTGFGRDDYVAMAVQLATIAGSFIMSINDTPFIRETFAAFDMQEVETTWTISSNASAKVTELIIRSRR